MRRGLVDGVGKGLEWLFGVSTTADLEQINDHISSLEGDKTDMLHLMHHQASLTNETLWEVQQTAGALKKLQMIYVAFGSTMSAIFQNLAGLENHTEAVLMTMMEATIIFAQIEDELRRWEDSISSLELGLSALALGKLPQTIFRPAQLQTVLTKLSAGLPTGWSLSQSPHSSDCLWSAYRDAEVATAVVDGKLRAFIRLPVYELLSSFTFYKVISMPIPTTDGLGATMVSGLPAFIAISKDTFIN